MSLSLKLRAHERLIVNGCVLRNGPRRTELVIETYADVLRGDELLDAETAGTPTRLLGYFIQIALVSKADRAESAGKIRQIAADLRSVYLSERAAQLEEVLREVEANEFYAAWRALRPLIEREDQLKQLLKDQKGEAG